MGPSDIMAKVYLWAHPVMSTIYAQWADVGFAEIFGKLSHRFYRPLRQRVRHGLGDGRTTSQNTTQELLTSTHQSSICSRKSLRQRLSLLTLQVKCFAIEDKAIGAEKLAY